MKECLINAVEYICVCMCVCAICGSGGGGLVAKLCPTVVTA